jgi:uncharacterized membrane protein
MKENEASYPQSEEFVVSPIASGSTEVNVSTTERVLSIFGGAFLSTYALRNPTIPGIILGAVGVVLVKRGLSGYSTINELLNREGASDELHPIEIRQTINVNKPREEVYKYWRKLENLPNFMKHLQSVTQLDDRRSHWVATTPVGFMKLKWDAEIVQDQENELISWRSVPQSDVDNSGEVRFTDSVDGKGTDIELTLKYIAPAGNAGETVAKLFNPAFRKLIKTDLRRYKQSLETNGAADPEHRPEKPQFQNNNP